LGKKLFLTFICIVTLLSCKKEESKIVANSTIHKKIDKIEINQKVFLEKLSLLKADSLTTNIKHKDSVLNFYQYRNNKPAWTNIENRNQLYQAIQNSYQEGLQPKDYHFKQLKDIVNNNGIKKNDNTYIDILFTDAYLSYAYHLAHGKVNYKNLHDDWDLPKNKFDFLNILNEGIKQHNIQQALNSFKPNHLIYKKLKQAAQKYKALVGTDSLRTIIPDGKKIRPHKSDKRIALIRKRLQELNYIQDTLQQHSIVLDSVLQKHLKAFQKDKNLATDAIIGKTTIIELNKSYQDHYNSILANLERWRWYPRNFNDNSIIVNLPEYKLKHIIKEKDTTTYTVVVGKTQRKTPVFSAAVKYLVFNPKWHVPPTIKKEDIIPSATKDPSSLTRKRITVYNQQGKVMSPDSIQWSSPEVLKYHYVQRSGSNNALGLVKIIFPNKYSVFLHDTNHRNLFKNNYRARSSGCVRVKEPFQLATEILQWEKSKTDSIQKTTNTKRIYPKQQTMVYMLYWNVIFNNNQPVFLHDVYNFNSKLIEQLKH